MPNWGGYWYWDAEKKTIMMHTKDGEELDIRQTDRPEYTFDNIASDVYKRQGTSEILKVREVLQKA